ncbi:MAG: proteasome assembly chaperone family protein [Candidatus Aenigmarchaeota archaeon]|nr:proteasome assembly chaperone family protein [Candidatus Aenigmarchaeota archaeon]
MATRIFESEKPKLKDPLFIEGLPGIGHVGRITAQFIVDELKAKKFAELLSSHFMHYVLLQQSSSVHVLKNEFYYAKGKGRGQRDLIILVGDSQSIDPEGHYEISHEILDYIKKFGVKEMITLGGLGIGEVKEKPKVIGAVSDEGLDKKYKNYGITFDAGNKVGTIIGASGLLLGLGKVYGMKGICLLGETSGYPILPDPRAAEAVLKVLMKMLNIKLNMGKLDEKVKEMEEFIKKIEEMQRKAIGQMMQQQVPPTGKEGKEELSYIG